MGIDDESSHPELCSEVADGVTRNIVCLFREPDAGNLPVRLRVQERLVCSVGDRPTKVIVRGLVAWIAERREIEFLMPIDKAIFQDGEQVIGP
jgi:hypothetical protein